MMRACEKRQPGQQTDRKLLLQQMFVVMIVGGQVLEATNALSSMYPQIM